jgi:hypothetical protein
MPTTTRKTYQEIFLEKAHLYEILSTPFDSNYTDKERTKQIEEEPLCESMQLLRTEYPQLEITFDKVHA